MALAQVVPQLRQQRIVGDEGQVLNVHAVGMTLAPRSPYRDEVCVRVKGPGSQAGFGANLVAGIHQGITGPRQLRDPAHPIFGRHKLFNEMDLASGIDLSDALLHGLYFGHAQRLCERMHLSIDIGLRDMVQVDQRQSADATARQGLDSP